MKIFKVQLSLSRHRQGHGEQEKLFPKGFLPLCFTPRLCLMEWGIQSLESGSLYGEDIGSVWQPFVQMGRRPSLGGLPEGHLSWSHYGIWFWAVSFGAIIK